MLNKQQNNYLQVKLRSCKTETVILKLSQEISVYAIIIEAASLKVRVIFRCVSPNIITSMPIGISSGL